MPVDIAAEVLVDHMREELIILDPDALLDGMELDTELASLGLDSMTMVAAVAALEERYAVRIPDEWLVGADTVGRFVALFQTAVASRSTTTDRDGKEPKSNGNPAECGCCAG